MKTLPRREGADLPETMFLRPRDPDDHREFDRLLPWLTPLFVYEQSGQDWVRWSVPKEVASKWGLAGGCACCGSSTTVDGDNGDYHVDTAWKETDWWLTANDYALPNPVAERNTPQKEK